MVTGEAEFVRPGSLDDVLGLLADRPEAQVVAGSTDLGVQVNIFGSRPPLTVAIDRLAELREFAFGPDEVRLGAALTLTEIERRLAGRVPLLAEMFPQFASRLIRNGATIGGNLGTGSPIGDTPPALLALDASIVLASRRGERVVALADYFTGYRQTLKAPDELIKTIVLPLPLAATDRVPQDRQAALRRHLERRHRVRRRRGGRRRTAGPDRDRRRRGHTAAGTSHRGGTDRSTVDRADGPRGGRGDGCRGYADGRPPRECVVPLGDARPVAAPVLLC